MNTNFVTTFVIYLAILHWQLQRSLRFTTKMAHESGTICSCSTTTITSMHGTRTGNSVEVHLKLKLSERGFIQLLVQFFSWKKRWRQMSKITLQRNKFHQCDVHLTPSFQLRERSTNTNKPRAHHWWIALKGVLFIYVKNISQNYTILISHHSFDG